MYIYTNAYAVEKEIVAFCENKGLRIHYTEEPTASFDGKTIRVQKPDPRWSERQWLIWRYLVYHETGHATPVMKDGIEMVIRRKIDTRKPFGVVLNYLDDYRQEYYKYAEYLGRQRVMASGLKALVEDIVIPAVQVTEDVRMQAIQVVAAYDLTRRVSWQPALAGMSDPLIEIFNEQQQDWFVALSKGDYYDILEQPCTAEEELIVTRRIFDEVFKLDSEAEEEEATSNGQAGDGEGDSRDAAGKDDAGKGAEEGEGTDGESAKGSGEVDYSCLLIHEHGKRDGGSEFDLKINYDTAYTHVPYEVATNSEFTVLDYTKHKSGSSGRINRVKDLMAGKGLSMKVRNLLRIKSMSRRVHGQKSGRISKRLAYRCTMKGTGGYQEKIFSKKTASDVTDTAVQVVVDFSGSMGMHKMNHAIAAGCMLNDVLGKINIPLEVYGFTDTYERDNFNVLHYIFKHFNSTVATQDMITNMALASDHFMGNNADGDSLLWGYSRLARRPEKRKIMIVLSDGSPATHRGDAYAYTQDVIKQIEKDKLIEIYGIGIIDDNVAKMYKDFRVIDDAAELEAALLEVVKRKIIG